METVGTFYGHLVPVCADGDKNNLCISMPLFSGRLTHYSHSLSSLRKPSVGGPEIGSVSGLTGPASNFYIARGETR
jgi:hypothetical protein